MDHTASLLLELGLLIFGLAVVGRLAALIGLSPIPFYLLGGLAFGSGGLVPLESTAEFVEVGAEVGVLLLLLLLGLEYTPEELVENLRTHAPAGGVDIVLNALPGVVAAQLLGFGLAETVALAGITYISSSGVIAKVLSDLGRLANRETPVVLSVLVMEDLVMAAYLPILTTLLAGASVGRGALTVLIAVSTVISVLYLALRHSGAVNRLVASEDDETLLLQVLGLTLLVAGVAQGLQVSAAVGAFLVGIALAGEAAERARTLLTPLRDLFAAVFFVFFGLRTDPGSIPPVILPALALAVAGLATKVATGWWAARRDGVARLGRWRAGAALVARGEFSIVIAGLAVTAGADPELGALAAAYVLLLAVVGPVLARVVEPVVRRVGGPAKLSAAAPRP